MAHTNEKVVLKITRLDSDGTTNISASGSVADIATAIVAAILNLQQHSKMPLMELLTSISAAAVNTYEEFNDFFEGE